VTPWGLQDQVRCKWLLQQVGKDGKQLSVIATYNKSLNDNATLVQVITDILGKRPGDEFDTETLIGVNNRLTLKHKTKQDGTTFPKIVAILRPCKTDPVLQIPAWFKRTGVSNNTPVTAATTAAPKARVQRAAEKSNEVASSPSSEQPNERLDSPPEPPDWDPADYDHGTSFPGSDDASDEHAA
jgi:hypothetical protein